jgi:hypothetical protein
LFLGTENNALPGNVFTTDEFKFDSVKLNIHLVAEDNQHFLS